MQDNNRQHGQDSKFGNNEKQRKFLDDNTFNPDWIKSGADEEMVKFAEKAGKFLTKKESKLSNTQIRNIFGEIKRIQMGKYEKNKSSFILLRPKLAYAVGRANDMSSKNAAINFKEIFEKAAQEVKDETTFHNFCNFMEAILAYHKANGGK